MYAKLINGKLTPAPANLCKDGTVYQNYNLESNAAMLLADGYKPVAEMPAPDEMKKPKKYYVENENRITAVYVETYVEPDYRSKRAAEYPDFREYLDAVVKIVRRRNHGRGRKNATADLLPPVSGNKTKISQRIKGNRPLLPTAGRSAYRSNCHMVRIISSISVYSGRQPSSFSASAEDAVNIPGSPALRPAYSTFSFLPVTFSAAAIISLTVVPLPVPRFRQAEQPPSCRCSTARTCARAKSVT